MKKKFIKVAYNISYYGEHNLTFWQKLFYKPPRKFKSTEYRTSRAKAEVLPLPSHYQFGLEFKVCSYTTYTQMV